MSDSNKSESNAAERSAASGKSKKKERRQKAKNEATANAETNHSNEKIGKESKKNFDKATPSTSGDLLIHGDDAGEIKKKAIESCKNPRPSTSDAGPLFKQMLENATNELQTNDIQTPSTSGTDPLVNAQLKQILDEAMKSKLNPLMRDIAKTQQEAVQKPFKFWSTQPVPKFDEIVEHNEPIEPNKQISDIRAEPYALPDGFKWETMKLDDPLVLTELYTLLNENYVEDDDAMFRFDYQPEFLKWALQPPGWRQGNLFTNAQ